MDGNAHLSPQQEFEQKMMERIRASIGDLIPDSRLKEIIDAGVQKAIFEPKRIEERYGSHRVEPPFIESVIEKLLKEKIAAAVDVWVDAHPEELNKAVENAVKLGVGNCIIYAMENRFAGVFSSLQQQISDMQNGVRRY